MEGWVKVHRAMRDWEWKKDPFMVALFMDLLLKANYKDTRFEGMEIKRGQLVTSLRALSEDTGLTIRQVRTCLSKLEKTNEITQKSTHKFTLLTIVNFDKFQSNDEEATNERHSSDTQATTSKNIKNIRNKENNNITVNSNSKVVFNSKENKLLIPDSFLQKLKESFNCDVVGEIKKAELWLIANPKKRKKNYERFLINWMTRAKPKEAQPEPTVYDEEEVEILGPIVDISKIGNFKKDPARVMNAVRELAAKKTVQL